MVNSTKKKKSQVNPSSLPFSYILSASFSRQTHYSSSALLSSLINTNKNGLRCDNVSSIGHLSGCYDLFLLLLWEAEGTTGRSGNGRHGAWRCNRHAAVSPTSAAWASSTAASDTSVLPFS